MYICHMLYVHQSASTSKLLLAHKIHGRICHIWRPKLRGQFFQKMSPKLKRTESGTMPYLELCSNVSVLFVPKVQCQITFRAISKISFLILKMLKWNHLLLLLNRKLWDRSCFEKPKIKQKLIDTVSCCLHKEAVTQRCSLKTVFLKISQNSQENTCARVSILIKLRRCFPVNFAKILRIPFLKDTHKEKAPSNETPALRKSTNMSVWAVDTLNQLIIIGS